jgi:hypothetical protein
MNSKLTKTGVRVTLSQIKRASQTPLFAESGVVGEQKFHEKQATFDGRPHVFVSRMAFRHGNRGLMVMADNHTEAVELSRVLDASLPKAGAYYPQVDIVWTLDPDEDPNAN